MLLEVPFVLLSCSVIVPRRNDIARLHRPWRAAVRCRAILPPGASYRPPQPELASTCFRVALRNASANAGSSTARATTIAPTHAETRARPRSRARGPGRLATNTCTIPSSTLPNARFTAGLAPSRFRPPTAISPPPCWRSSRWLPCARQHPRGANGLALQCRRVSRSCLHERLHLQGQRGSGAARRLV